MKSKLMITILAVAALLFNSCTKEPLESLVPKTVDQNPNLPCISVNGARLHSEAFGHPDSSIIVFLHGGPGGDYRYLLNGKELAEHGYRVVFYDQRGSGLSQRFPKQSYTSLGLGAVDQMYDDLSGVIAHYRTSPTQKVFLMGRSWGGMLAAGYAAKYPDAIQGLVVGEPGGLKWNDVEEYVTNSQSFNLWSESLNNLMYLDQFFSGNEDQHELLDYRLMMQATTNDITGEDYTLPGSTWRSGAVVNAALFEVAKEHKPDFSHALENFHKPVLFFYTENNKAYPDAWANKISGAFNSATVYKIPGTGHGGIVTDKAAWSNHMLPQILTFLASL